jgi:competence CoiA-like predicted nuclease
MQNTKSIIHVNSSKVPFGLRDNRLYTASQVQRGNACDCVCPGCRDPLQARQGTVRRHYFAHTHAELARASCSESALHRYAKQIILEAKKIGIPEHIKTISGKAKDGMEFYQEVTSPVLELAFTEGNEEKAALGYRPDITVILSGGETLFLEIMVTHAVGEDKASQFEGHNLLEIDLSSLDPTEVSENELDLAILHNSQRAWLQCTLFQAAVKKSERKLEAQIWAYEAQQLRKSILNNNRPTTHSIWDRQGKSGYKARREEFRSRCYSELNQAGLHTESSELLREKYAISLNTFKQVEKSLREQLEIYRADWPEIFDYKDTVGWIFGVHHGHWQSALYLHFIKSQPLGRKFSVPEAHSYLRNYFRTTTPEWFNRLDKIRGQECSRRKKAGKTTNSSTNQIWYFDLHEHRWIPSSFNLVRKYLNFLILHGYLSRSGVTYSVVFNKIQLNHRDAVFEVIPYYC